MLLTTPHLGPVFPNIQSGWLLLIHKFTRPRTSPCRPCRKQTSMVVTFHLVILHEPFLHDFNVSHLFIG